MGGGFHDITKAHPISARHQTPIFDGANQILASGCRHSGLIAAISRTTFIFWSLALENKTKIVDEVKQLRNVTICHLWITVVVSFAGYQSRTWKWFKISVMCSFDRDILIDDDFLPAM